MSDTAQLLLLGLPGSGKTTFLAALWHVLADTSATSLRRNKPSGDRRYLNQITEGWRQCSQVPRTNLQMEEVVVLHLAGDEVGAFDLSVPDLSGEAFEQQLVFRRMSPHHDALVQKATGVMLFVHPDVQKGTQLTQAAQLEAVLAGTQKNDDPNAAAGAPMPWSVEMLPTQVKLVELLQLLLDRTQHKVRVAVVVSAWDLVDSFGAPHEFLSRELPLLHQFLNSNSDLMEHTVFGVSAQGGDITVPEEKQALLELDDALKRIKVRQGNDNSHDITMPIAWLLGSK